MADNSKSEMAIAVVSPVGTNLEWVQRELQEQLKNYGYILNPVRLSKLCAQHEAGASIDDSSEYDRIWTSMDAGNAIREAAQRGDAVAMLAVADVAKSRGDQAEPLPNTVHFFRSLKHPQEVALLRRVYGEGFWLVGAYADEEERFKRMERTMPRASAEKLNERDAEEEGRFGQRTRKTFALSDVFVRLRDLDFTDAQKQLARFLELVFGNPHVTPTADEHAMYMAYAASLRSGDLSRQVGAAIVSAGGDIIGIGANDVPRAGGGLHWPDDRDDRDYVRGADFNEERRETIANQVISALFPEQLKGQERAEKLRVMRETMVADITEYGRAVHAEMEAILACARAGVSTHGSSLFATTFPCHNCGKHIIDAGIQRLVFVEPYPKSLFFEMYDKDVLREPDASKDSDKLSDPRVRVEPFIGVGARRYVDLFSMGWSSGYPVLRKKKNAQGEISDWSKVDSSPRIPMIASTFLDRETEVIEDLNALGED